MSLANLSDNFVSHAFIQLSDLKQLDFSTDRPTNLLIEAPFRSLRMTMHHRDVVFTIQMAFLLLYPFSEEACT